MWRWRRHEQLAGRGGLDDRRDGHELTDNRGLDHPRDRDRSAAGVAQFDAEAAPLIAAYIRADKAYVTACCTGTDYVAEATAVQRYQAANRTFVDRLSRLTPPPGAAAALETLHREHSR